MIQYRKSSWGEGVLKVVSYRHQGRHGVGVVAGNGIVTLAKTAPGLPDDLRKIDPKFTGERFRQYLAAVDALKEIARVRFGKSVVALAVRWILDCGPTIALWGAVRR